MIKSALEYIISSCENKINVIDNKYYSTKDLCKIPDYYCEKPICSNSLESLVNFIKYSNDVRNKQLFIQVDFNKINVYSNLNSFFNRSCYFSCSFDYHKFDYQYFIDLEKFKIEFATHFCDTENKSLILKLLGNLKSDNVKTVSDDGFSQLVTVKSGVASVSDVIIPNPIKLKEICTFYEIDQPEKEFLLRFNNDMKIALFHTNSSLWKYEVINNIKIYLKENLSELIEKDLVIVC